VWAPKLDTTLEVQLLKARFDWTAYHNSLTCSGRWWYLMVSYGNSDRALNALLDTEESPWVLRFHNVEIASSWKAYMRRARITMKALPSLTLTTMLRLWVWLVMRPKYFAEQRGKGCSHSQWPGGKWLLERQLVLAIVGLRWGATSFLTAFTFPSTEEWVPIYCWINRESFWKSHAQAVVCFELETSSPGGKRSTTAPQNK